MSTTEHITTATIEADPDLMEAIASEPRLMPHLHLSLQHGDDLILKRMKRRHLRDDAIRFCDEARRLREETAAVLADYKRRRTEAEREAEAIVVDVLRTVDSASRRQDAWDALAKIPHVFVPTHHGEVLPVVAKAPDEMLPAWAPIRTPHAVLSDMFLVETERGCSRRCATA